MYTSVQEHCCTAPWLSRVRWLCRSSLNQLLALFVVTSDSEDPIAELTDLREKVDALKQSASHSRWLPQSVNYCVVLHDSSQSDPAR